MTFNVIKNRKVFFAISIALVVVAVVCFFVRGFNLDIEFVGGTEYNFELKNGAELDKDALSKELSDELGDKFSSIRIAGDNSFVVRTTLEGTDYESINNAICDSVKADYEVDNVTASNGTILVTVLGEKVVEEAPVVAEETAEVVETEETVETEEVVEETTETEKTVKEVLEEKVASLSDKLGIDGAVVTLRPETENVYEITYHPVSVVSEVVKAHFSETVVEDEVETVVVNVALKSETTVSAEVSDSLKTTAIIAALVAIICMLIYIAFRFEGRASIAAIVCLAHDILMVMLAYSIFQIPVGSTVIAVILTILGYSINATIVIFDRIRENRKNITSQYTFDDAADSGIISGVYSSVCLSGNVWVALKKIGSNKK